MTLSNTFKQIKEFFAKPQPEEDETPLPDIHEIELQMPVPTWLSERKWVMTPDGVGIVVDLSSHNQVGVMLTDDKGENLEQHIWRFSDIRLAKQSELPKNRQGGFPPPETLTALGYL